MKTNPIILLSCMCWIAQALQAKLPDTTSNLPDTELKPPFTFFNHSGFEPHLAICFFKLPARDTGVPKLSEWERMMAKTARPGQVEKK